MGTLAYHGVHVDRLAPQIGGFPVARFQGGDVFVKEEVGLLGWSRAELWHKLRKAVSAMFGKHILEQL